MFGSLLLAFIGLLIGVWLAQFSTPGSLYVFTVPFVMNVCLGFALIRIGARKTGEIIVYGGALASIMLPFVLL